MATSRSSAGRRLEIQISSAGITWDGGKTPSDQRALKAALEQADIVAVDVQAEADAPAQLVLAALTLHAGPRVERRLLSWGDLKLEVTDARPSTLEIGKRARASIFSWRAKRATQLWSIGEGPAIANLGPYEPGDEKAEPAVVSRLAQACAPAGCSLDVELREQRLLAELRAWQRVVAAVGSRLELHFSEPPPPRNAQDSGTEYLPPAAIQAVVRFSYGRFKTCYEAGLARNPKLEGRVMVRFVIERDGIVKNSRDGGSEIPDPQVSDCIVHEFVGLQFPALERGLVTVVYPILLSPG